MCKRQNIAIIRLCYILQFFTAVKSIEIGGDGRTRAVVCVAGYGPRVPGSSPGRVAVCCGLEQVTFTLCLVLVSTQEAVDV